MSREMVIDASITLAWLLNEDDSASQIGRTIKASRAVAPLLWRLEVVNTILVYERRKRLTEQQGFSLLRLVDELAIELIPDSNSRNASTLATFARPHQLTAYDALYLELSIQRNLPLFTRDNNLRTAAKRIGIELV